MAKTRVQTVKDLAGSRFDWEQTLRDLSRAIPADVTLTSLNGDISNGAGGSGNTLRTAISAPAISAPGLHLVADVGRPPDGAPARHRRRDPRVAVELRGREDRRARQHRRVRDASSATPMPCGAGSRPKFDVVMFFEKDAAAVATTPTTATGSVGATPTPPPTASATPSTDGTTAAASTTTTTTTQGGATP